MKTTITLTFGDVCENHKGMQKIGEEAKEGFKSRDLKKIKKRMEKIDKTCVELIRLHDDKYIDSSIIDDEDIDKAYILIIRKGVDMILKDYNVDDLLKEQKKLDYDKKAYMYGRVVNKNARYNLCFAKKSQDPDYENKKGRVIAFKDVPILNQLRERLPKFFGDKSRKLMIESNYYYDINKTGIGFHGDTERKKVIGIRLGAELPLHFQWYQDNKPIGKRIKIKLNHGDIYIMSEKATGNNWKKKKIATLRHAAGCKKFL